MSGRIVRALERIADALDRLAPVETDHACTHPPDQRDHTGATMGRPRWRCTACGYQYEGATSAAGVN